MIVSLLAIIKHISGNLGDPLNRPFSLPRRTTYQTSISADEKCPDLLDRLSASRIHPDGSFIAWNLTQNTRNGCGVCTRTVERDLQHVISRMSRRLNALIPTMFMDSYPSSKFMRFPAQVKGPVVPSAGRNHLQMTASIPFLLLFRFRYLFRSCSTVPRRPRRRWNGISPPTYIIENINHFLGSVNILGGCHVSHHMSLPTSRYVAYPFWRLRWGQSKVLLV